MYNDDYIIMFDENGQPYLAHSIGSRLSSGYARVKQTASNAGRATNRAVKYIMKIPNAFANGASRYFYTQDEIRAFQRERQANRDLKKVQNTKDQTKKALKTERANVSAFVANKRANEARTRVQENRQELAKTVKNRADTAKNAVSTYGKTKLGEVKTAVKNTSENVKDASKKAFDEVKTTVQNVPENVKGASKKALDDASNKAKEIKASAKEIADGVKIYRDWRKNLSVDGPYSIDQVYNNKVAREILRRTRNAEEALDKAVIKAASKMEGADLFNKHLENGWKDGEYEEWIKTPHGKFFNDSIISEIQTNGLKSTIEDRSEKVTKKAKDSLKRAADFVDEHDAGLNETLRYATQRNKVDQDEKDRLHDEMTATPLGRAASRVGSVPQDAKRAAQTVSANAQNVKNMVGDVDVSIPTVTFSKKSVSQIVNEFDGAITTAQANTLRGLASGLESLQTAWENASGSAKTSLGNTLNTAADQYNDFIESLKIERT